MAILYDPFYKKGQKIYLNGDNNYSKYINGNPAPTFAEIQPIVANSNTNNGENANAVTDTNVQNPSPNGSTISYKEQLLQDAKDQAYQDAEATKQQQIVDANSSYAQNLANYGANAERMAQMGLTGSGYSDYINASAYAQNRADIKNANAQALLSKQQADMTYTNAMANLKEVEKTQAANEAVIAQENGDYYGYINGLIKSEQISADTGKTMIYDYLNNLITSDTANFDYNTANKALANGIIDPKTYDDWKNKWNSEVIVDDSAFYKDDGSLLSKTDALKAIDAIKKTGFASEETIKKLQETYDKFYKISYQAVGSNRYDSNISKAGTPFYIDLGNTPISYQMVSGGQVEDAVINDIAIDIKDDTVFILNEKLYVKNNGIVYSISPDSPSYSAVYNKVKKEKTSHKQDIKYGN